MLLNLIEIFWEKFEITALKKITHDNGFFLVTNTLLLLLFTERWTKHWPMYGSLLLKGRSSKDPKGADEVADFPRLTAVTSAYQLPTIHHRPVWVRMRFWISAAAAGSSWRHHDLLFNLVSNVVIQPQTVTTTPATFALFNLIKYLKWVNGKIISNLQMRHFK